ncbi:MAG: hypothetical protein ACOC5M_00695 [Chloroflexota bacterium]
MKETRPRAMLFALIAALAVGAVAIACSGGSTPQVTGQPGSTPSESGSPDGASTQTEAPDESGDEAQNQTGESPEPEASESTESDAAPASEGEEENSDGNAGSEQAGSVVEPAAARSSSTGEPRPQATATPTPSGNPAAITVSPEEDFNPIRTQHTFTATVTDSDGDPVSDATVEWFLNRFGDAVGDVVEVQGEGPQKVDNQYAVARTNSDGESMIVITSTREGATDVTAFVPDIEDDSTHKVFAIKNWVDMDVDFPGDATNFVGTEHPLTVHVFESTTGEPIEDQRVRWTITDDDPDAYFEEAGEDENSLETTTGSDGRATVTLRQASGARGTNTVTMEVVDTFGEREKVMFDGEMEKEWRSGVLELTKEGPEEIGLLGEATYDISLANSGDLTADEVVLTDEIPDGMEYVSSDPAGSVSGDEITWDVGDLDPDASRDFVLVLSAEEVGEWTNTVAAESERGLSATAEATTDVQPGDIEITKSGPSDPVQVDTENTYDIEVTNSGSGAMTGVTLEDTIPDGMTLVSADPPTGDTSDDSVTWDIGTLPPGESRAFQVTMRVDQAGNWENTATASSAEGQTGQATFLTEVVAPSLVIEKAGPATRLQGDTFEYEIDVTNEGPGVADEVIVTDELPSGLDFESASPEPEVDGSTLTWDLGTLDVGESETVTVVVTATEPGNQRNVASVGSEEGVSDEDDAETEVVVADVEIEKDGPAGMFATGERVYTLTVNNTGTAPLNDVVVTDVIPEGLGYVSSNPSGSVSGDTVTWEIDSIAAGESESVNLTLLGETRGTWTNVAEVETAEGVTDTDEMDITVLAAPGATISIVDENDPVAVGEEAVYNVGITNQSGQSEMTNVEVSLRIPSEMTFVSADGPTEASVEGNQVVFESIDVIEPGDSVEMNVTLQADEDGDVVTRAVLDYAEFSQSILAEEGTTIFEP